jgi:hypothetical protein
VWSIGLTPNDRELFAVGDSGAITEVNVASGQAMATFDPAAGQPIALMRVASAA